MKRPRMAVGKVWRSIFLQILCTISRAIIVGFVGQSTPLGLAVLNPCPLAKIDTDLGFLWKWSTDRLQQS